MSQLPLELRLDRNARFDTFAATGNEGLVAHLRQAAAGQRADLIWLAGPTGVGKTHLLQAACRAAAQVGRRAIYLALGPALPTGALAGLGSLDLVALDDVGKVAGDAERERALFTVLDQFYRSDGALLMAARTVPAGVGFRLADLASRAAGSIVYRLEPLPDEARVAALIDLAAKRGMELETATAAYLLKRIRRDMRVMAEWLERLDRASLAAQRRITIPFVRGLLAADESAPGFQAPGED